MTATPTLKRTSLFDAHRSLGAKMVPFAGWEMPVQYQGVIDEHRAVRTGSGLFDVSHMGEFEITGAPKAFLHRITRNDVCALLPAAPTKLRHSHTSRGPSSTTARSTASTTG